MTTADAPPLSFDQWSDISVRCEGRPCEVLLDLLEQKEIAFEHYQESRRFHLAEMARALSRGDMTAATAYGKACAKHYPKEAAETGRVGSADDFQRLLEAQLPPPNQRNGQPIDPDFNVDSTLPLIQGTPTLQQYARLHAELAHSPWKAIEIRARFGLGDSARFEALERLYRKRFELDARLEVRFRELFDQELRGLRR